MCLFRVVGQGGFTQSDYLAFEPLVWTMKKNELVNEDRSPTQANTQIGIVYEVWTESSLII